MVNRAEVIKWNYSARIPKFADQAILDLHGGTSFTSKDPSSLSCNGVPHILYVLWKGGRSRGISLTEASLDVTPSWHLTTCIKTSKQMRIFSARMVAQHYQTLSAGNHSLFEPPNP